MANRRRSNPGWRLLPRVVGPIEGDAASVGAAAARPATAPPTPAGGRCDATPLPSRGLPSQRKRQ